LLSPASLTPIFENYPSSFLFDDVKLMNSLQNFQTQTFPLFNFYQKQDLYFPLNDALHASFISSAVNTIQTPKCTEDTPTKNIPEPEINSESVLSDPSEDVEKPEQSTVHNDFSTETESVEDASDLVDMVFDEQIASEDLINEENPKLQASKSPIIDALVYCALKGWGIELFKCQDEDIQFRLTDFSQYYERSAQICAKQNPTEDEGSRIKALKRWFPDFPTKRERGRIDGSFIITVQKDKKDNKPKKMRDIIEKTRHLLGISKIRRQR